MRWRLVVDALVERDTVDETQYIPAYLSSENVELYDDEDGELENQIDLATDTVNRRLKDFEAQGSGWKFAGIERVAIYCSKHSPITRFSYIPTPKSIASRFAIVNAQNADEFCFLHCILAHIHPKSENDLPYRVSHYQPYLHELNYKGLKFPLKI